MYLVAVAALRAAAFAAAVAAVEAAFSLSHALGDDMVLQRDATSPPASVWGFAEPGTVVTTTFRGADLNSTADATGAWITQLDPDYFPAKENDLTITISASSDPSDVRTL